MLTLTDGVGIDRAGFSLSEDGTVGLNILDSRGVVRIDLRVWDDDLSALVLSDSNGEPHASIAASSDGPPSIVLADKDAQSRVDLRVLDGEPSFVLTDDGNILFNVP